MRAAFREQVEGILVVLAKRTHLTKTAAHKLFYLIEVTAVQDMGKLLMGLKFKHTDYGMWSPLLAGILRQAVERGILERRPVPSDVGEGMVFHVNPEIGDVKLPDHMVAIVNKVLDRYGGLPLITLIASAKATSPFVYSEEGEWVDWEMAMEEQHAGDHMPTPETVAQLEKAREEIEEGRGTRHSLKEALQELD